MTIAYFIFLFAVNGRALSTSSVNVYVYKRTFFAVAQNAHLQEITMLCVHVFVCTTVYMCVERGSVCVVETMMMTMCMQRNASTPKLYRFFFAFIFPCWHFPLFPFGIGTPSFFPFPQTHTHTHDQTLTHRDTRRHKAYAFTFNVIHNFWIWNPDCRRLKIFECLTIRFNWKTNEFECCALTAFHSCKIAHGHTYAGSITNQKEEAEKEDGQSPSSLFFLVLDFILECLFRWNSSFYAKCARIRAKRTVEQQTFCFCNLSYGWN